MIYFYNTESQYYAVASKRKLTKSDIEKLSWLFSGAIPAKEEKIEGYFTGPRKEMITPWSTNAVEITQNMGINGIIRIEQFIKAKNKNVDYDSMLQYFYTDLTQDIFTINKLPAPIQYIEDISAYNQQEGLALSSDEIEYLNGVSNKISRKLTDSEVFGFSQVNSEHCRHKIFNGTFIIDGEEKKASLFDMIRKTSKEHPNSIVSAYNDNVAFCKGPEMEQFAPKRQDTSAYFDVKNIDSVISLKAETHNFPTTVEPFNGAATGSGGEIRDRMAGGKGSFPIAGTAVYMTSYPRLADNRKWEEKNEAREWLYQTPEEILIKASNGASDFGNKFGQPLICGSVLTFEHFEGLKKYGYDKVIMLAGGIGFAKFSDSLKDSPEVKDKIVVLGGDNYRIGMGGGAVSSVATGEYDNAIELNAVQRANPEMQKRVYNAIRALSELDVNPIVSVHDHGAGGHLNALSELVEETGGTIDINKLPVGDPTLSAKEIIGNESQERMGLVLKKKDIKLLEKISERERAPMYVVGEATGEMNFTFTDKEDAPMDLKLEYLFGKPPKTILDDKTYPSQFKALSYDVDKINEYVEMVLQLEAVACKDWLTNKVDRSVTGKIAKQQTTGAIQLPLNNLGVVAFDYNPIYDTNVGKKGIATAIGHAPISAMIDPAKGSVLSIAEALTNIIWAPLEEQMKSISLSANWMWPCKNEGEDARLYKAVEAASEFAIQLGINIPTGKDSLSMTQKYKNNETVFAPGTVIISAGGEVKDINKVLSPVLGDNRNTALLYIDLSSDDNYIGGSSFAQAINLIGDEAPTVKDADYFKRAFNCIQQLISEDRIMAGHDVSAGGLITTLLEMTFTSNTLGLNLDLSGFMESDNAKLLFCEKPAIVVQIEHEDYIYEYLYKNNIKFRIIGNISQERTIKIKNKKQNLVFDINKLRNLWFRTSYLLDRKQSGDDLALQRFDNYSKQELKFDFPEDFQGGLSQYNLPADRKKEALPKAAIIREKGVNGDREMAYSMYLAGFDVKDVHMTDLIAGRENLEDINFIVFVGGFSNSDVLGSAKGWAGAFLYNPKAKRALDNFYKRSDTLSLGVCNGCQLMVELGLINPNSKKRPKMLHNESHKFESTFINVSIPENNSVMLNSLTGTRLGIWVAHGEGKFSLPYSEDKYSIPMKYSYEQYPGNPNGSDYSAAALCSPNGRHLAMMPHLERAIFPWHWAHYPEERKADIVTPWLEAFVNAKLWVEKETAVPEDY